MFLTECNVLFLLSSYLSFFSICVVPYLSFVSMDALPCCYADQVLLRAWVAYCSEDSPTTSNVSLYVSGLTAAQLTFSRTDSGPTGSLRLPQCLHNNSWFLTLQVCVYFLNFTCQKNMWSWLIMLFSCFSKPLMSFVGRELCLLTDRSFFECPLLLSDLHNVFD